MNDKAIADPLEEIKICNLIIEIYYYEYSQELIQLNFKGMLPFSFVFI